MSVTQSLSSEAPALDRQTWGFRILTRLLPGTRARFPVLEGVAEGSVCKESILRLQLSIDAGHTAFRAACLVIHHPFLTLVSRVESILRVSGSRSCTGQSTEGLQENREREGFAIDRPNQNKKKTIPFSVSPPTIQVLYRRETKARLLHSTFGGEHSDLKRGLCY